MLTQIQNPISKQMARVTDVVPYLDVPCFPNGTYPMHDLQAATSLLFPEFYEVTRLAATIGEVGQVIINTQVNETQKNIYALAMSKENQARFYQTILPEYNNFNYVPDNDSENTKIIILSCIGAVTLLGLAIIGGISLNKYLKRNQQKMDEERGLISS